jgi:hypothetical protein
VTLEDNYRSTPAVYTYVITNTCKITKTYKKQTHLYMHTHTHKQQTNNITYIDMHNHIHKQQDTHFTIT